MTRLRADGQALRLRQHLCDGSGGHVPAPRNLPRHPDGARGRSGEKELGSITNLYVTPVTRLEFLIGKQLPYIGVALANIMGDPPALPGWQ